MFDVAESGHKLSKKEYDKRVAQLRAELLQEQEALKDADFPVIIVISGVDGAGKGETVKLLNEWFDPRYLHTLAFDEASDEEREHPEYWRFWRTLPPSGIVGIYLGSWYSEPIAQGSSGKLNDIDLDNRLQHIRHFEKLLVDDGALIIKFWLHLSKEAQKNKLRKLERDPLTAWRVTERDRNHLRQNNKFRRIAEHTLNKTGSVDAPWIIVDSGDKYYRGISVGQHILDRLGAHLHRTEHAKALLPLDVTDVQHPETHPHNQLRRLDMSRSLPKQEYHEKLERYQGKLNALARAAHAQKFSSIIVLEGWDAAGKGGLIRRIVPALDPRIYQVIPTAAPTDEELAHHYLWRFWRHVPRDGKFTLFDRSWYGRVLVERVESYANTGQWQRAYAEINDFEHQLTDHGIILAKFWVHIDKDEQLRRFRQREKVPYKRYKITKEDYRNREKWDDYEEAVSDMLERTNTDYAPWTLLEGNDKRYARIKALRTLCEKLEKAVSQ